MEKFKEELSLELYNIYGIAEWHQKYTLLTFDDRTQVLNYFKEGSDSTNKVSELIEQLKQPFPKFVVSYLSSSQEFTSMLERDPQLPYKLFFLTDSLLQYYGTAMKDPEKLGRTNHHYRAKIEDIFSANIDDFHSYSASQISIEKQLKFTYLTQYIDLEEAKKLRLSSADTFARDGVDGYEFEKKMDILNPRVRTIMMLFLGLYGHHFHGKKEIPKLLGCSYENAVKIIDILFPLFIKSTGVFENALGYDRESQINGNMHEYRNKVFRDADIALETAMLFERLSEVSKQVLLIHPFHERKIYLAAKFMFKDPQSLAKNLNLSTEEATKIVERVKNI